MFLEILLVAILLFVWFTIGNKQDKQVKVVLLGFIFGLVFDVSRYLDEYAIIIGGIIIMMLVITERRN